MLQTSQLANLGSKTMMLAAGRGSKVGASNICKSIQDGASSERGEPDSEVMVAMPAHRVRRHAQHTGTPALRAVSRMGQFEASFTSTPAPQHPSHCKTAHPSISERNMQCHGNERAASRTQRETGGAGCTCSSCRSPRPPTLTSRMLPRSMFTYNARAT